MLCILEIICSKLIWGQHHLHLLQTQFCDLSFHSALTRKSTVVTWIPFSFAKQEEHRLTLHLSNNWLHLVEKRVNCKKIYWSAHCQPVPTSHLFAKDIPKSQRLLSAHGHAVLSLHYFSVYSDSTSTLLLETLMSYQSKFSRNIYPSWVPDKDHQQKASVLIHQIHRRKGKQTGSCV